MLFHESGFSYVLSPGVQGRVTVSLHDVSWDQALRFVLDSLSLTYQREDNVYLIGRRAAETPPREPARGSPAKPDGLKPAATPGKPRLDVVKVLYSDPAMIAAVLGGTSVGYTYGGGGLAPYGIGTFGQPGLYGQPGVGTWGQPGVGLLGQPGVGTYTQPGVGLYGQPSMGTQPFGIRGTGMTGMTTPWSLGTSTARRTGGSGF
jgi:hypothetical protein